MPWIRIFLTVIAYIFMGGVIIWIGRHMVADLSEFIENDKEDKHEQ